MYQDSLEIEERLKQQSKVAADTTRIVYEIRHGKTLDDLKNMGYTVEQTRASFLGAREARRISRPKLYHMK